MDALYTHMTVSVTELKRILPILSSRLTIAN